MYFSNDRRRTVLLVRLVVLVLATWIAQMAADGPAGAQSGSHDNPWSVEPNRPYPKRTPATPLVDTNPSRPSRPVP